MLISASVLAQMCNTCSPGPTGPGPSPTSNGTASKNMSVVGPGVAGGVLAGDTRLYLARRGHHRSYLVGCVTPSSDGNKMLNEKGQRTYSLLASNGLALERGKRLKVYGKKLPGSGRLMFDVQGLGQDYGNCSP
jgi:hypothetical protein